MIVVDTNVVSEAMKAEPAPAVVAWLNGQRARSLYSTAINVSELRFGIERLPEGAQKTALWSSYEFTVGRLFGPRILPFDRVAAEEAARIATRAEAVGKTLGIADGQIAAISKIHGFVVATRDVQPFSDAGIEVLDPWTASPEL
ncbi:MAG: type II toxin-antitoxin system VapC family toxin [Rhodospirillaceae bacterium]|nr:type II toxin-antitoxin system VapC family toxin [Rhodospirillaceae bacterium]